MKVLPLTAVMNIALASAALAAEDIASATDPPPTRIVAGHVTRADDGSPVVGAKIYMKQTGPAVTDTNGYYELRHQLDGYRSIWINADGLATENRRIDVWGKKRLDGVDWVLEPSYQIRGLVLDEQGQPVEGAVVHLREWSEVQTRAAADGSFHLDCARSDRPEAIEVESPDCDEYVLLENPPSEVTLMLCQRKIEVIGGVVVDLQGQPAVDIRVHLCPKSQISFEEDRDASRHIVTDATGAFRYPLTPGDYDLLVYNWQQTQVALLHNVRVAENERKTDLVIQLIDRPEMPGRVQAPDPSRYGRKELTVRPVNLDGLTCLPYWFYESALTDEAGRFQVRQLLPGRYLVELFGDLRRREAVLTQTINVTEQTTEIVLDGNEPDVERQ